MPFRSNKDDFEYYTLVNGIHEESDKIFVTLERSMFYVEGGGQPSDKGSIHGREVLSMHEINGETWHELENGEGFFPGMRVKVWIDAEWRLEMSRQHTGQHLLSAYLDKDHALRTVGFHVGSETATIDTDGPVTEEILDDVTAKVLLAIREGIPVSAFVETGEGSKRLGLRKETDLAGDVQIIRIGDLDFSACCGTHVESTRDLLFFIIRKQEKHKEGSRIYFQFGRRALDFAMDSVRIVQDIKEQLGVHETELPFRVGMLIEQTADDHRVIQELREKLASAILKDPAWQGPLVYQELNEEEELIRTLSRGLGIKKQNSILLDLRELRVYGNIFKDGLHGGRLFKENKNSSIRGGGGPNAFQGVADSEEELVAFGRRLKETLEER